MKVLTAGKYYGVKKSEIDLTGVILSEYDYSSSRTDWHFHENPYFILFCLKHDAYIALSNK